jgi:hypothetical protein
VILEDDLELAPMWYCWLRAAWDAYMHRKDLMGISLNRETLNRIAKPSLAQSRNPVNRISLNRETRRIRSGSLKFQCQ